MRKFFKYAKRKTSVGSGKDNVESDAGGSGKVGGSDRRSLASLGSATSVASTSAAKSSEFGSLISLGGYGAGLYQVDLKGKDKKFTKLHRAAWGGDLERVKKQVKKDDVNAADALKRTPLHLACARGNKEIVWFLLGCKGDLSLRDCDGFTPMLKAVQCRQTAVVQFLLERAIDPNDTTPDEDTALHLVAKENDTDMALILLSKGANVDAANKAGQSPLHVATENCSIEIAELFLRHGASVNAEDIDDRSCLMLACRQGSSDFVSLFMEYGANMKSKDKSGLTATDYATIAEQADCLRLLGDGDKMVEIHGSNLGSKEGVGPGGAVGDADSWSKDELSDMIGNGSQKSLQLDSWNDESEGSNSLHGKSLLSGLNLTKFMSSLDAEDVPVENGDGKIERAHSISSNIVPGPPKPPRCPSANSDIIPFSPISVNGRQSSREDDVFEEEEAKPAKLTTNVREEGEESAQLEKSEAEIVDDQLLDNEILDLLLPSDTSTPSLSISDQIEPAKTEVDISNTDRSPKMKPNRPSPPPPMKAKKAKTKPIPPPRSTKSRNSAQSSQNDWDSEFSSGISMELTENQKFAEPVSNENVMVSRIEEADLFDSSLPPTPAPNLTDETTYDVEKEEKLMEPVRAPTILTTVETNLDSKPEVEITGVDNATKQRLYVKKNDASHHSRSPSGSSIVINKDVHPLGDVDRTASPYKALTDSESSEWSEEFIGPKLSESEPGIVSTDDPAVVKGPPTQYVDEKADVREVADYEEDVAGQGAEEKTEEINDGDSEWDSSLELSLRSHKDVAESLFPPSIPDSLTRDGQTSGPSSVKIADNDNEVVKGGFSKLDSSSSGVTKSDLSIHPTTVKEKSDSLMDDLIADVLTIDEPPEGTLGREDTLHGVDEIWEKNPSIPLTAISGHDDESSDSSQMDAEICRETPTLAAMKGHVALKKNLYEDKFGRVNPSETTIDLTSTSSTTLTSPAGSEKPSKPLRKIGRNLEIDTDVLESVLQTQLVEQRRRLSLTGPTVDRGSPENQESTSNLPTVIKSEPDMSYRSLLTQRRHSMDAVFPTLNASSFKDLLMQRHNERTTSIESNHSDPIAEPSSADHDIEPLKSNWMAKTGRSWKNRKSGIGKATKVKKIQPLSLKGSPEKRRSSPTSSVPASPGWTTKKRSMSLTASLEKFSGLKRLSKKLSLSGDTKGSSKTSKDTPVLLSQRSSDSDLPSPAENDGGDFVQEVLERLDIRRKSSVVMLEAIPESKGAGAVGAGKKLSRPGSLGILSESTSSSPTASFSEQSVFVDGALEETMSEKKSSTPPFKEKDQVLEDKNLEESPVISVVKLKDPQALMKLQEFMSNLKIQLEREKGERLVLSNQIQCVVCERDDLNCRLESVTVDNNLLRERAIELETKLKGNEWELQQAESRWQACESKLKKMLTYLNKKEDALVNECSLRQQSEMSNQSLLGELCVVKETLGVLHDECRQLQNQFVSQQTTPNDSCPQSPSTWISSTLRDKELSGLRRQLDEANVLCQQVMNENQSLQLQLNLHKQEILQYRQRIEERECTAQSVQAQLEEQVECARREQKVEQEALNQATLSYMLQIQKLECANKELNTQLKAQEEKMHELVVKITKCNEDLICSKSESVNMKKALEESQKVSVSTKCENEQELQVLKEEIQSLNQKNKELQADFNAKVVELEVKTTKKKVDLQTTMSQEKITRKTAIDSIGPLEDFQRQISALQSEMSFLKSQLIPPQSHDTRFYETSSRDDFDPHSRPFHSTSGRFSPQRPPTPPKRSRVPHSPSYQSVQTVTWPASLSSHNVRNKHGRPSSIRKQSMFSDPMSKKSQRLDEDDDHRDRYRGFRTVSAQGSTSSAEDSKPAAALETLNSEGFDGTDFAAVDAEFRRFNEERNILEEQLQVVEDAKEELNQEKTRLELELEKTDRELDETKLDLAKALRKVMTVESELRASQQLCKELSQEHAEVSGDLKIARSDLDKGRRNETEMQSQLEELKSVVDRVNNEPRELRLQLEEERMHSHKLQDELLRVRVDYQTSEENLLEHLSRNQELNQRLEDSIKARELLENRLSSMNEERVLLLQRLDKEVDEQRRLWEVEAKGRAELTLRLIDVENKRRSAEQTGEVADGEMIYNNNKKNNVVGISSVQRLIQQREEAEKMADKEKERCSKLEEELLAMKREVTRLSVMEIPEDVRIQIEQLQQQVWDLKSAVKYERDEHARHRGELKRAKVQVSLIPRLKKRISHLEEMRSELRKELINFQHHVKKNCVDKEEMEKTRMKLETVSAHELNVKLSEMRIYLDQQSKVQEQLDQARLNNEVQLRTDLQISKNELQEEIHRLRLALDRSESKAEALRLDRDQIQQIFDTDWRIGKGSGTNLRDIELPSSTEGLVTEPPVLLRNNMLKQWKESLNRPQLSKLFVLSEKPIEESPVSMIYKVKAALDKSIEHHLLNQQPY